MEHLQVGLTLILQGLFTLIILKRLQLFNQLLLHFDDLLHDVTTMSVGGFSSIKMGMLVRTLRDLPLQHLFFIQFNCLGRVRVVSLVERVREGELEVVLELQEHTVPWDLRRIATPHILLILFDLVLDQLANFFCFSVFEDL